MTVKLRQKLAVVLLAALCFLVYVFLDLTGILNRYRWAGLVLGGSWAVLDILLLRKQKRNISLGFRARIFFLVIGLLALIAFLRGRNTFDGFVAASSLVFAARELYVHHKHPPSISNNVPQ